MARARNRPSPVIRGWLDRLLRYETDEADGYGRPREQRLLPAITKRSILIAVLLLLAVMAARATAAPNVPVVAPPIAGDDACDGDSAPCAEGTEWTEGNEGNEGTEGNEGNEGNEGAAGAEPSTARLRHVVRRHGVNPCAGRCATPCSPCALPIAVSAVAAAGLRAAGLAEDPTPSWRYRTRLAGMVPQVSVRVGRNLTWKDVEDPTLGYTNMWDVRASWHLERLLFDPNEIRIEALDVSRRRERRRVEMMVIHTYYQWLAAVSERPELTADLDAMTAGWFSDQLAKGQKP